MFKYRRILPSILNMCGIDLPEDLQVRLKQFIVLPGENANSTKLTPHRHALTACTTGEFQPPQPISLMVSQGFTLKMMEKFIRDLKTFLTPIDDSMDMLIFFTLHDSKLFLAYVKQELKMNADLSTFRQALKHAGSLLAQVCNGKANYTQISASGTINLETLDIQREFSILLQSKQFGKLPGVDNTPGVDNSLADVRNMVNLLKVSSHIQVVRRVCEQYKLERCLEDTNLIKLTAIAEELMTEEAKASLTPSSATERIGIVRELLDTNDYEYLAIFPKIADSSEFYQFICEKGFTDDSGQARFYQQFQLITAQLQHEEYDEAVLNHLYAAYKLILPFTVKQQSFHSLLVSVKQLMAVSRESTAETTRDYSMQIETVNRNINLIQLWFSRAEV